MDIHNPYLNDGAKPIFHKGSKFGCLCIHGFSAAPTEICWLGDHLHSELGMTTYTLRLAGHGTDPVDMRRMRWKDWYLSVRDGYELLANQCDEVYVAGISMGGLLALLLTAAQDTDVQAAAVIAAPLLYRIRRIAYTRYLKWLRPMMQMPDKTQLPEIIRKEQERRGEPAIGRTHYDVWSLSAMAELYKLSEMAREEIHHIDVPLSLIYAEQDHSVSLESIDYIKAHSNSPHIDDHVLRDTGHIITQDIERDYAFQLVEMFFARQLDLVTG